jgi:hypothetical protein
MTIPDGWSRWQLTRAARATRCGQLWVLGATAALAFAAARAEESQGGIWKAVVPPTSMHGEFDNDDPIGLGAGVRISADCSINWVDPDTGKLYCFSSATSLVVFLDAPHGYLERARAGWLRLRATTP